MREGLWYMVISSISTLWIQFDEKNLRGTMMLHTDVFTCRAFLVFPHCAHCTVNVNP